MSDEEKQEAPKAGALVLAAALLLYSDTVVSAIQSAPEPYQRLLWAVALTAPWWVQKRSRQHILEGLADLVTKRPDRGVLGLLVAGSKAFGWSHSSEDPEELLRVLERKAAKQGMALKTQGNGVVLVPSVDNDVRSEESLE